MYSNGWLWGTMGKNQGFFQGFFQGAPPRVSSGAPNHASPLSDPWWGLTTLHPYRTFYHPIPISPILPIPPNTTNINTNTNTTNINTNTNTTNTNTNACCKRMYGKKQIQRHKHVGGAIACRFGRMRHGKSGRKAKQHAGHIIMRGRFGWIETHLHLANLKLLIF